MAKKQRQPSQKLTVAEIEDALVRHYGNLTATARELGLASVYRLRERVMKTPRLHRAMQEGRMEMVGIAEDNVIKKLKEGHEAYTNMVLANFGRAEGWGPPTQRIEMGVETIEVIEDWGDNAGPASEEDPEN